MKRYPAYKDTGVDWIGEIPIDWIVRKIKHNTYVKGRIGWQGLKTDEYLKEGFAYLVTGSDFFNEFVNWRTCFYVDKNRYEEDPHIQLKEGDLLITKDGTIGKIALVKNMDKPSTLNSGIFLVRPLNDQYSTNFLYWILCSTVFSGFFEYHKSGSTISHLYQNVFVDFGFPVPQITIQSQIVTYLNHKTRQIDDLIAKKQKLIELLKEERTAIINHAVTKGLDPSVPMKDSGIEWIGAVPEHWVLSKIKRVFKNHDNKRIPLSSEERGKMALKVYDYYGASGIIDKVENYLFYGEYILIGEDGANILTRSTAMAFKATGKFWVNNHAHILEPIAGEVDYFVNLLEQIDFSYYATGSAQPKLTQDELDNMLIPVPPLEEQNRIVKLINTKCSYFEAVIDKVSKEIELISEYKTSLINEVVTGKIQVSDAD